MSYNNLFHSKYSTGQTIRLNTPSGPVLDACDGNLGALKGQERSIQAVMCDGASQDAQWRVFNIVDEHGFFLDHAAVYGAVSDDQATMLCVKYLSPSLKGVIHSATDISDNGLKTFLDGANTEHKTPFLLQSDAHMLDSLGTVSAVQWNEDCLASHDGRMSGVMLDMARCDVSGQLLEKMTAKEIADFLLDEHCTDFGMLDAMIIKNNQLDRVVEKIADALRMKNTEEFFVKNVTVIEPFKRQGVVNVGAIFEMSDSQTITVLFNNPDATPSKLTGTDILTSWKWMLNKRDVTAILQPRAVDAKKYPMIASRIFKLLAKNHGRFERAQLLKDRNLLLLNNLVDQLESGQSELLSLKGMIQTTQQEIDAETERKRQDAESALTGKEENPDDDSEESIIKKANALKDLLLSEHGFAINDMAKRSLNYSILETPSNNSLTIGTFTDDTNNGKWAISVWMGSDDNNKLKDIDTNQSIEQIAQQIIESDKQAIELTGDEFGDPADTATIRKAVKQAMLEINGQSYPCPALGADVEIRKSGTKKVIKFSADVRKLQAVAALKELLENAVKYDERPPYNAEEERNIKAYHFLHSAFILDEKSLVARFVVREDDKGHYHYDHTIHSDLANLLQGENAKSPLLDGLSTAVFPTAGVSQDELAGLTRLANCQLDISIESDQVNVNSMLDGALGDDSEILNMFITENEHNEHNVQNTQNNAPSVDEQFLNDVIAGTADMLADETGEKLETIGENLDEALADLFEQAVNAYTASALNNAKTIG